MYTDYILRDHVMRDITTKAVAIKNGYTVDECVPYLANEEGQLWFGYVIKKNGEDFVLKMHYAENEVGDLAIVDGRWKVIAGEGLVGGGVYSTDEVVSVTTVGREIANGLSSLGEIFTLLDIKKSNQ